MANLISYVPYRVDECKLRFLKKELAEKKITVPSQDDITRQQRTELQKTIADILAPMCMPQASNYLLALQRGNGVSKQRGKK